MSFRRRGMSLVSALGPMAACVGVAPHSADDPHLWVVEELSTLRAASAPEPALALTPSDVWALVTRSPQPLPMTATPTLRTVVCIRDESLTAVAQTLADGSAAGLATPSVQVLKRMLRKTGSPITEPEARVFSAPETANDLELAARIHVDPRGLCGVARARGSAGSKVSVVAAALRATLEPVPTRVRVGAFVPIQARSTNSMDHARIFVLAPNGKVHTLPTSLQQGEDGSQVSGQFVAQMPGSFSIQIVTEQAQGPLPLFEFPIFVDVAPPPTSPGAVQPLPEVVDADVLQQWIERVRGSRLKREPRLDELALHHANRMRITHTLAHDAGDGLPTTRLANLEVSEIGENVAHGKDLQAVHDGLLQSPSHRAVMLNPKLVALGLGIAKDHDGTLWVTELFSSALSTPSQPQTDSLQRNPQTRQTLELAHAY